MNSTAIPTQYQKSDIVHYAPTITTLDDTLAAKNNEYRSSFISRFNELPKNTELLCGIENMACMLIGKKGNIVCEGFDPKTNKDYSIEFANPEEYASYVARKEAAVSGQQQYNHPSALDIDAILKDLYDRQ